MSNNFCDICLNTGRPVKFISDRIQVCQWCVSLLQDTPINPEEIQEHLLAIVRRHARKPPAEPDKDDLKSKAYSRAISQESLVELMFTSIFNKEKRKNRVREIFDSLYHRAHAAYVADLEKYNSEIEAEIEDHYKKLLSGEYMPRELTHFFGKRDIFSSRWDYPIKGAYKDSLDSTDKKYLKYIRAFNNNLLSGLEKSLRPNENEMQITRSTVKTQDRFHCKICSKPGSEFELHVHHIIPLDKYGSNHPNNLITLCHSCHNKQHSGFQVTRNIPLRRMRTGGNFVALDIETTGLSSKKDYIIEIAAVKFMAAQPVEEYCTLVRPAISIPHNITSITGITDSMVAKAPYIDEIFHEFLCFIKDYKLVAHNSAFDMRFLQRHAQELGYQINNEIIDTLQLSRKKVPFLNNHKLQTLVWHFNISTNGKHRALADSHATAQVYIECLRTTNNQNGRTRRFTYRRECPRR
jgi:DNA polymerase III subunit epsilon